MQILVTGGLGFIGSELTKKYLSNNHKVVIIDNESTSCKKIEDFNHPNVSLLKIDLAKISKDDESKIIEIVKNCDYIYHFASSVGVEHIDKNPKSSIQNMQKANLNSFELFNHGNAPVIFASSSEVYGETVEAEESDDLVIKNPKFLRGGYAASKIMGEYLIQTYSFPYLILRFFNVTGPNQLPDHGMVLPKLVKAAKNNSPITIYNNGEQIRSFCDVRDAIEAIYKIVHEDKIFFEVINIGNSQNTTTIKNLALEVKKVFNSDSEIIYKEFNKVFTSNTFEINKRIVNDKKISQYYKFKHSLRDLIKSFKEEI